MKEKIKLLVITHTFPTKYHPTATVFILNQLKELKKYCKIKVVYPHAFVPRIKKPNPYYRFSKVPFKEKIDGVRVYHPKYLMFPRILLVPKFLSIFLLIESFFSYFASKKFMDGLVEKWKPDIIHAHGVLGAGLLGMRLKSKYKKPLLLSVWGEDVNKYSKEMFSKYLARLTLRNSDAIICQSKYLKEEINKIGIKENKFFVITTGALLSKFKPKSQNKARKTLKLPVNKKIILFVGHLVTRKGVEYLIRALKLVLKKEESILCCIVGKGYEEPALKKLASELNLNGYVSFAGEKTNDEVSLYMNACDLFVLPSLSEGLPVVLCEALACGKPVVATNVAGTPELVNGDVGYLVKPKDVEDLANKIVLALNKKWDKHKLLKRGKEFSVSNSARKLMRVYKSFLKKKLNKK